MENAKNFNVKEIFENLSVDSDLGLVDAMDFVNDHLEYKDFQDVQELYDYLNDTNNANGYITDDISEFADLNVPIYNSELLDWLKDNYDKLENSIQEFGIDSENFDLIKQIQLAYYSEIQNELYEYIQKAIEEIENEYPELI